MRSISKIVKILSYIFEKTNIRYAFVGAIAVGIWGEPRATRDVDVIMALDERKLKRIVPLLEKENFDVSKYSAGIALKEKSHFTIFDKKSKYVIDVVPAFKEEHFAAIEDRKKVKFDKTFIYVASPESTIATKILFGSAQDIKDAKTILIRKYKELDFAKLAKKVKLLGVEKKYLRLKKWVERRI